MGEYQKYRGNSENKLFYLIDDLYGGINTEYNDDVSQKGEFKKVINFNLDKRGTLVKRKGFGKLDALSQIFNNFVGVDYVPECYLRTKDNETEWITGDRTKIVYMKLLRDDNHCFRNLSAFTGDKAYRQYQEKYGFMNNEFDLLVVTTRTLMGEEQESTFWRYTCKIPSLAYDSETGEVSDEETIEMTAQKYILDNYLGISWNRRLKNVKTIDYYNKTYFVDNNYGILVFDRSESNLENAISYAGFSEDRLGQPVVNSAYKPLAAEAIQYGFNLLGNNPISWVDNQSLSTESVQGVFFMDENGNAFLGKTIPSSNKFKMGVYYTGENTFNISFKQNTVNSGFEDLSPISNITLTYDTDMSVPGNLAIWTVEVSSTLSGYIEVTVEKPNVSSISKFYDYFTVSDVMATEIEQLDLSHCQVVEFGSSALYYKNNLLLFSYPEIPTYVPHYNYIEVPLEPTDEIVRIIPFRNVYVIFTKYKIYKLSGTSASDAEVLLLNDSLGCCAPDTIVPIENVIYFMSDRGLYMLTSNYSYNSSTSALTFENVKELDDKVKTLTSNFVYRLDDTDGSSVSYNNVNKYATAIRYNDSYMLFYNSYFSDNVTYETENDIDVLVYNYDLKAFTTNRFNYKPVFLFMVDNRILTYSMFKDKDTYEKERHILRYDFTKTQRDTIIDETHSGYNAKLIGKVSCSPGKSISFNNPNSYVDMGYINTSVNGALNIELDTKASDQDDCTLLNLTQSDNVSGGVSTRGSIISNIELDHYTLLEYIATPNRSTGMIDVEYTIKLCRTDINDVLNNTCSYRLTNSSGATLLSASDIVFEFAEGASELVIDTGTFTVSGTSDYNDIWTLIFDTSYGEETLEWKGSSKSGTKKVVTTQLSYAYITYSWAAVPYNGGSKVTFTDVGLVWTGGLYNNSGKITLTVDGKSLTFTMKAISVSSGTNTIYSTTSSKSTSIAYTGSHSATIKGSYNIAATINGTYYSSISTAEHTITLPKLTQTVVTTETPVTLVGSDSVNITSIVDAGGYTKITYNKAEDRLTLTMYSSGRSLVVQSPNNIGFDGEHNWLFKVLNSSNFAIYKDGQVLTGVTCSGNLIVSYLLRDINYLGVEDPTKLDENLDMLNHFDGEISSLEIYDNSNTILSYDFIQGSGVAVYDTSNNIPANLYDITWITDIGCIFDGGYIQIPTLSQRVPFENGFEVSVDMICNNISGLMSIFDFATNYNTPTSGNNGCSINGTIDGLAYQLESTGIIGKRFKIGANDLDLSQRHLYTYSVVDNGKSYTVELKVDGVTVLTDTTYSEYNSISNIKRESNFIGRSNNPNVSNFSGIMYSFSLKTAYTDKATTYSPSLFEYGNTYDEFGEAMDVLLETKGYNLGYPQHLKKLKKVFLKMVGGYNYNALFFEVYKDNFRVNNTGEYVASINNEGVVVYDYIPNENLLLQASTSRLNLVQLDKGKYGEQIYQMQKFATPAKGKNFSMKFYGKCADNMELQSIGLVCKLGKVKE